MISREIYEEVIFQAIAKGATTIAPDIRQGFEQAIQRESRLAAKEGLEKTYASILRSAQLRNRKIAFAIIVENGGGGGTVAAPIARKIILSLQN